MIYVSYVAFVGCIELHFLLCALMKEVWEFFNTSDKYFKAWSNQSLRNIMFCNSCLTSLFKLNVVEIKKNKKVFLVSTSVLLSSWINITYFPESIDTVKTVRFIRKNKSKKLKTELHPCVWIYLSIALMPSTLVQSNNSLQ